MLGRYRSIFREYIGIPSRQFLLEWKFRLRSSQGGKKIGNNRFPRIMVFTQVRDEADIIRDWVAYHISLFGNGNVVVMDDNSGDGTIEILKEFGEDITVEQLAPENQGIFNKKHNFTRKMAEFKGHADILIPLDADEFVALFEGVPEKEPEAPESPPPISGVERSPLQPAPKRRKPTLDMPPAPAPA